MLLVMANNYISLKTIMDKTLRHPLMAGISFEAVIDYTIDFMRIVQCGGFFEEKCIKIPIKQYKGVLPDDFYEVNQIRLVGEKCNRDVYEEVLKTDEEGNVITIDGNIIPTGQYIQTGYVEDSCKVGKVFTYSTDTFHMSEGKSHIGLTYKIQGDYIFTSIKEGEIELAYKAILIDELSSYPMIPDNSKFTRALQAYIKKEWFTILFDMGKLQGAILQNAQQEYAWAVGACESEFQKMSLDKAESFYNSWSTLIPRRNQHQRFYTYNGSKQNLKIN
jgi:hypothetical protein